MATINAGSTASPIPLDNSIAVGILTNNEASLVATLARSPENTERRAIIAQGGSLVSSILDTALLG